MLACQGGPRTRATFSVRLNISSGDGGQNLECNEQRGKETGGETRVIPVRGLYAWGPIVRPLSQWIYFVRSMHAGLKQVRTSFKAKIQICGLPPSDEMCDYSEANLKITRFSVFDSRFSTGARCDFETDRGIAAVGSPDQGSIADRLLGVSENRSTFRGHVGNRGRASIGKEA